MPSNLIKKFFLRSLTRLPAPSRRFQSPSDPLSSEEMAVLLTILSTPEFGDGNIWTMGGLAEAMLHAAIEEGCCRRPYYAPNVVGRSFEAMKRDFGYDRSMQGSWTVERRCRRYSASNLLASRTTMNINQTLQHCFHAETLRDTSWSTFLLLIRPCRRVRDYLMHFQALKVQYFGCPTTNPTSKLSVEMPNSTKWHRFMESKLKMYVYCSQLLG